MTPEREGREGDSQGMPRINNEPYVHDAMIADIEARKVLGTKRYGTPLQPHNGRNALLDAYEEALDLAVYLKQALIEQDVPEVEVTTDKPVPISVVGDTTPVRRSGARNVSSPHLQAAFIDEARHAMGAPTVNDAQALVGQEVRLVFNVDWVAATGKLTNVVNHPSAGSGPFLILDDYRERIYPLNSIQSIEVVG
jgi:hypothetical protein